MKTACPKDCPGRTAECHAKCETYKAAYQENLRRYAAKQKDFAIRDVVSVGVKVRMQTMHKKQKQI